MSEIINQSKIYCSLLISCVIAISVFSVRAQEKKTNSDSAEARYLAKVSEARKAIGAGNAQWIEGWRRGDAKMVAAIFTEDGMQLQKNGKIIRGREAIRNAQERAMRSVETGVEVKVETAEIWIVDGDAYEAGKWTYKYVEKGKKEITVESGRYVTKWKKQKDGSWKLYLDMNVPLEN